MDDGIFNAFDIPEMQIVEQAEDLLTIGDTANTSKTPEPAWDPLEGF
jgi:hypothetical protein